MNKELVLVIDFGGQYNQLVARRVRENNVYCEIYSYKTPLDQIKAMNPKGIILTGGPASCYEEGAASCDKGLFEMGVPVLGLCYGAQLMSHVLGGKVEKAPVREYGHTALKVDTASPVFEGVPENTTCWMSHFDYISKIAPSYTGRKPDAQKLPLQCLWMCGRLEDGFFRSGADFAYQGKSR